MANGSGVRWLPRRAESRGLLAAGVALGVVAVLVERWHGPSWVLLALAVAAGVGVVLLERRRSEMAGRDDLAGLVGRVSTVPTEQGELRTVNQLGPRDFRVGPSTLTIGYLRRDHHGLVRAGIVEGGPVLVVGHAMAGKSRMAYEVLRALRRLAGPDPRRR